MRTYLILLLCTLMVGCAPQILPANQSEKDFAVSQYTDCLQRAAMQFDDHKSDPATIAFAITPICRADLEYSAYVFSKGLNPEAARLTRKYMLDDQNTQIQRATAIVLQNRKRKHSQ